MPTRGVAHPGFSGFLKFVARKKRRCKLIGMKLRTPALHQIIELVIGYSDNREHIRTAMIKYNGAPIELIEFEKKSK